MPRSLFLKIFLWFGAVVLTVIVGTFLVGELTRPEHSEQPLRRPLDSVLSVYAQTAAEIYERDGQTALVEYIERVERESRIRAFLFNRDLQELSGRRMPDGAPGLARSVFETRLPQSAAEGPAGLSARPAVTSRGGQYVLVVEMPRRPQEPPLFHQMMHLLAIVLIGGLFCYWLARHLTSPVAKLRAATQELASGNLGVRVAPALGKRRDELASLGADFDLMAEKIESLINSQRRLLGDISHELRSPLARLNVALELARQRSGPEAISALERIQREAENLNEMIGQLLALTRLESGAESAVNYRFDLAELVREIADDADFEARSRNRSVILKSVENSIITGNQELLRRAIENVVRNAVHYTDEGTAAEIELRLESGAAGSNALAVITVRDYGAGVPEDALKEIFRPFYRVEDARDRDSGGTGLGLAIAERAVKLHGGTVEACNAQGGGLRVIVTIPDSKQQTADGKQPNLQTESA